MFAATFHEFIPFYCPNKVLRLSWWGKRHLPLALLASLCVLAGCANTPKTPPLDGVRDVQVIGIETTRNDPNAYSTAEGAAKGAGAGLAGGALLGLGAGLEASVACGPAFPLCAPFFAGGGLVVGGVVGGVAGAASGAITGLTSEQAEALEKVTANVLKSRNWDADFVGKVVDCAGEAGGGVVNGDNPEATIEVQLTNFKLVQEAKDMISIRMEASMVLKTKDDGKTKLHKPVKYVYRSESAQVGDWIQNGGARFSDEFDRAFADLSRQIAGTLWGEAPAVKCKGEAVPAKNETARSQTPNIRPLIGGSDR